MTPPPRARRGGVDPLGAEPREAVPVGDDEPARCGPSQGLEQLASPPVQSRSDLLDDLLVAPAFALRVLVERELLTLKAALLIMA